MKHQSQQTLAVTVLILWVAVAWPARSLSAAEITVDVSAKHQTIEGFGTCLISWMPRIDEFYQTPMAAKTYAEDLRFNFLRCNLWGDGTIPPTQDPDRISHQDPAFAARDRRTQEDAGGAAFLEVHHPRFRSGRGEASLW